MSTPASYQAGTTGYDDLGPDRPLFGDGELRTTERIINWGVGFLTSLMVLITLISSFVFAKNSSRGLNIYFGICILLVCFPHLVLIYWYRQGGMDPKCRYLIYYNALSIFLLSICANCYFHGV